MKKKNLLRIVVLVIACAWIGWQYLPRHHKAAQDATPATAGSVASVAPASAATVAPATWKLGSLTLHACAIGGAAHGGHGVAVAAWCGQFEVPENRADPAGRKIKLHLAIIRSAAEKSAPDMVTLLAGGPGQAATDFPHLVVGFPRLHRHHDFLLLDQRGTGGSNPLTCAMPDTHQLAAYDPNTVRKAALACLKKISPRADPRFYTTTDAVADLEAVRKALGSPKLDLIGTSYGTRVALQYLRAHPKAVRSVVLDSPLPNQVIAGQGFAQNLHAALVNDFALCAREPACHQRFPDPMHALTLLRQALAANPHKVDTRDPWTFKPRQQALTQYTLADVVRLFAYARGGIELLPLTIDAAAHGDVGPMLGQYAQLMHSLSGKALAVGMNWSVICTEDASQMHVNKADATLLMGNRTQRMYAAVCPVWPHGKAPADFHEPDTSSKPVLILSGALDPVLPPAYGKMIAKHLTDARQIIFKGQGHALVTSACGRRLIGQFIRTANPHTLDTACVKRLTSPSFFLNFNGAAP